MDARGAQDLMLFMHRDTYSRVNGLEYSSSSGINDVMATFENCGFISLVLTVAAVFISYVTPYWLVFHDPQNITRNVHGGLLALCELDECKYFLSDLVAQNSQPGNNRVSLFLVF